MEFRLLFRESTIQTHKSKRNAFHFKMKYLQMKNDLIILFKKYVMT